MAAVRRNIVASASDREAFIEGVRLLKQESSGVTTEDFNIPRRPGVSIQPLSTYDLFVIWHVAAMNQMTPAGNSSGRNAAHMGPAFLPWHRWMLLQLELQFQRVLNEPDFGLPYWDWAEDGEQPINQQPAQPIWSANCLGGDGRASDNSVVTGPFRNTGYFRVVVETDGSVQMWATNRPLRRRFDHVRGRSLPQKSEVTRALNESNYDEEMWDSSAGGMRNHLEGWVPRNTAPHLHNLVHVWIGGDMGPASSPNDPAFFLNHCNVDRVWAAWQDRHPTRPYLPTANAPNDLFRHRRNDPLHSMLTNDQVTPGDMLNVSIYYSYDNLQVD